MPAGTGKAVEMEGIYGFIISMVIALSYLWGIVIRKWETAVVGCASCSLYQRKIT